MKNWTNGVPARGPGRHDNVYWFSCIRYGIGKTGV